MQVVKRREMQGRPASLLSGEVESVQGNADVGMQVLPLFRGGHVRPGPLDECRMLGEDCPMKHVQKTRVAVPYNTRKPVIKYDVVTARICSSRYREPSWYIYRYRVSV